MTGTSVNGERVAKMASHALREGDRVRLADTDLFAEVERDLTTYGEEVKFGGGKVIRDGMGQSQRSRAESAVDTVVTNAVILDHWGIIKADIGISDGRIAAADYLTSGSAVANGFASVVALQSSSQFAYVSEMWVKSTDFNFWDSIGPVTVAARSVF